MKEYPKIDMLKTGENIRNLRIQKKLSVRDVQAFLGMEDPRAIYLWQSGKTLPTVDHLCALSVLFEVSVDEILILDAPIPEGKLDP